jgi:hypothetical protein
MRRRVEFSVLAILAAAVVLLVLNHLESDEYPAGIDPRATSDLPTWLMPTLVHACETCKECTHRFEPSECRLNVTVRDRDGWYRLFWSGTDTYVYDDPALVGGALRNRTAELEGGTWIIRGRYRAEHEQPVHSCSEAADQVELTYRLKRGAFPGPADPALDPSGTVAVPSRIQWFRYPYPPDRVDDFWWELENPGSFAGTAATPCRCSK